MAHNMRSAPRRRRESVILDGCPFSSGLSLFMVAMLNAPLTEQQGNDQAVLPRVTPDLDRVVGYGLVLLGTFQEADGSGRSCLHLS